MARGTHWWNEPPLWAWIVMVVGAVSLAVLLPIALQRTAPVDVPAAGSATTSDASSSSPSAPADASGSSAAASTSAAGEVVDVVVLGDGDSAGETAWPALLDEELGNAEFQVAADAGAGYVTTGAGGRTIPQLADDVDVGGVDLVVVLGSRNDGPGRSDEIAEAAGALFADVAAAAPDAELLVIGPPWFSGPAPAGIRANRDALRAAVASAGGAFVDPLAEGWFADRSDLLTATGNPSQAGQRHLAELIGAEVRTLLRD